MGRQFTVDRDCAHCGAVFQTMNKQQTHCWDARCRIAGAKARRDKTNATRRERHVPVEIKKTMGRPPGRRGPQGLAGSLKGSVVLSAVDETKLKDALTRAVVDEAARRGA